MSQSTKPPAGTRDFLPDEVRRREYVIRIVRDVYQCDIDAVGSTSRVVEGELVAAVSDVLMRLGFDDFVVRLNHRRALTALLECAGVPAALHDEALVALDKLDK